MTTSKNALQLLSIYENDSSEDDEVPGFRVSTKRMWKDEEDNLHRNKIQKLPLPNLNKIGFVGTEAHLDDPNLHDGRVRSFPHERGNWATYVYIPYEPDEGISNLMKRLIKCIDLDMSLMQDLHVSLTKTVVLRHHWIDSFLDSIRIRLGATKKFALVFNSLKVYCNEDRTRTFLGVDVQVGYESLLKIVENLNLSLQEFNLATFYENPSFHMSIAWSVGDHEEELRKILPNLNQELQSFIQDQMETVWYYYVTYIHCKCGNKLFTFALS